MSALFDQRGNRKYLTASERKAFLISAKVATPPPVGMFCTVLAYTGARVSEVLALTPARFDLETGVIVIRSLKKRRHNIYRAVPVPSSLFEDIELTLGIQPAQADVYRVKERLWPWGRTTAWQRVKDVMAHAGIDGPQATPKGLRHGFAVAAIQAGVPLNVVRKWLGHARLQTTAIYADAVGEEERSLAERMWETF